MKKLLCVWLIIVSLSGCGPKGETDSLDSVLNRSRGRYELALRHGYARPDSGARRQEISDAVKGAENLVSFPWTTESCRENTGRISSSLSSLMASAGYPSRPAMREVSAEASVFDCSSARPGPAKLLSSRVYDVLAAELEGAAFSVS